MNLSIYLNFIQFESAIIVYIYDSPISLKIKIFSIIIKYANELSIDSRIKQFLDHSWMSLKLDSVPALGDSFSCFIEREYENQTKQSPKTPPLTPHIPFSI